MRSIYADVNSRAAQSLNYTCMLGCYWAREPHAYTCSSRYLDGQVCGTLHDDSIKWKNFHCHWPFMRGIHQSPVNFPHKGQWRGTLMFSLICAWINGWVNNYEAGDLRHHRAHYDVTVMKAIENTWKESCTWFVFLFCFMVVSLWLIFPTSFRVTSLTLEQSYNCQWSNPEEYGFIHNVE